MAVNTYVSTTTLNDSGLNTPIKGQSKRQDKRKKPPALGRRTHRLKVKEWKTVFHANRNDKKAAVTILISNKTNFNKGHKKRLKGTPYDDKRINTRRGFYTC